MKGKSESVFCLESGCCLLIERLLLLWAIKYRPNVLVQVNVREHRRDNTNYRPNVLVQVNVREHRRGNTTYRPNVLVQVNVREHRRGNTKWTIQRNLQHRVHKMKKNKNTTQHVLDITMDNQAQIT